jgi:hypothetical protein
MIDKINNRRLPVTMLAGMAIATIGLELPVLAVPQPAPILVAQIACVVKKQTAVFTSEDPRDPEVLNRILPVGTPIALVEPLSSQPPYRVEIKPTGFVPYVALDCGRRPPGPQTSTPPKTSVCRLVRSTVNFMYVRQDAGRQAPTISDGAGQPVILRGNERVFVTQTGEKITSRGVNGEGWVEVDLKRTFGTDFGIRSGFGWLSNTDPGDSMSTLVYCP